jgi:glycolipid transfer protein (GLTP)
MPVSLAPQSRLTVTDADIMGSVAFTPVKNDMLGNVKVRIAQLSPRAYLGPRFPFAAIDHDEYMLTHRPSQKLRDRLLAHPAESETVQQLCINELKTKKHSATEGLLWLVR